MPSTERLELLMERAADGELSAEKRHEVMEFADRHPDGWRQLACRFLEEQLIGRSIRQSPLADPWVEESIVQPIRRPNGFWYHHPALTTAITILLAFTLGLVVPWNRDVGSQEAMPVQAVVEGSVQDHSTIADDFREELEALQRRVELLDGRLLHR